MKKRLIYALLLLTLLISTASALDTWHNTSYDKRNKVEITFDTITESINNTIVKLNVSSFPGYLDSLKIYDNATGLEYPWQWYFESNYDSSGTKEYANDTIIFLGNFTNNTKSIVYVYTNTSFISNFNTTLLDIIWDFENTNNSFRQKSYNDTDFITGGYSISTQESPSNGSVLNLTNTYGGLVNLQQAISPQFTSAPSEVCYWQKSQYLTTRKNQSEYTVRIGYQNESVRNTYDLLGDNNFSAVFGDMYYFNDMIDISDFKQQALLTDQGGIILFESDNGACSDIDIPNGVHTDTTKTYVVELNLSSNSLLNTPILFQLRDVADAQVMAIYVYHVTGATYVRNNGAWDSISGYTFPQDEYNLFKIIVEPQNQRYLAYINGVLLEGYKSFSSPSYTGDLDTIRFGCGSGDDDVDLYIDYAYVYGYANEENERIYSTPYNEGEWEYTCNRNIDFSADTYTPEFDLTSGSITNITDDAIANDSLIVNNYLTAENDYIFLDRIFINYATRNYIWMHDPGYDLTAWSLTFENLTVPSTAKVNDDKTITVDCIGSTIEFVKINITDPSDVKTTYSLTSTSGNSYSLSFSPQNAGNYTFDGAICQDSLYYETISGQNLMVVSSTGGGGSSSPPPSPPPEDPPPDEPPEEEEPEPLDETIMKALGNLTGSGGGALGFVEPVESADFDIVGVNFFNKATKQLGIKPGDSREYCLEIINKADVTQTISLSCELPDKPPRNDLCDWYTFDKKIITIQPSDEIREKFCMQITTPPDLNLNEAFVVFIKGTSTLGSVAKHPITMIVSDPSQVFPLLLSRYFDDTITQSSYELIRDNITENVRELPFSWPNILFPLILLNHVLFFVLIRLLSPKMNWLVHVILQIIFFLVITTPSIFFPGLMVGLTILLGVFDIIVAVVKK